MKRWCRGAGVQRWCRRAAVVVQRFRAQQRREEEVQRRCRGGGCWSRGADVQMYSGVRCRNAGLQVVQVC